MNRCRACRRPLTSPASLKHGYGPDCLKRAVRAGTAPLEALEELQAWQRSTVRQRRQEATQKRQAKPAEDTQTADLFAPLRQAAVDRLKEAAAECQALGVVVTFQIHE